MYLELRIRNYELRKKYKALPDLTSYFLLKTVVKPLIALVLLLFSSIYITNNAYASTNFKSDYNVIYSINEAGTAHANMEISLTNTTADFFASSYQIQLGFQNLTNIKASDQSGPLNTTINKIDNGYNLQFLFDKKTVGLGRIHIIKLTFDTENIAQETGGIWEINIPGIAHPDQFNSFKVEIKRPESFGKIAYIKPLAKENSLIFDKQLLGKSGISIAFGENKIYKFILDYHLKNSNLFPSKGEIALPPDTSSQKIFIQSISPKPVNVVVDPDGNWLAQYDLSPAETKDIKLIGLASVKAISEKTELTKDQRKTYTTPTKNWQANTPEIKNVAQKLKSPKEIYNFVVKYLKYDYSRVIKKQERLGGINSLKNPKSAVCREFADLFITLARSNNIPAREVDGYAYTTDSTLRPLSLEGDILHSWPEYYDSDKKSWVMVDPTWGNTTGGIDYFDVLDFNHLAFVIKGTEDNYPFPAGGYKQGKSTKDVDVSTVSDIPTATQQIKLDSQNIEQRISGLPIATNVIVSNNGQSATSQQIMNIKSQDLSPKEQALEIPSIPPYGHISVEIKFDKTNFLTNKLLSFTIRLGDKTFVKKLQSSPFYLTIPGR